jgi:hypothetical protein
LTHPKDLDKIPEQLPIKQTNLMTVHVFSSCPMGENLQKCAVNSFGKVHGFNNLLLMPVYFVPLLESIPKVQLWRSRVEMR